MSDKNLARRTKVGFFIAGTDISDYISHNLISFVYTDNEEDEADDLQTRFADKDDIWLTEWLNEELMEQTSASGEDDNKVVGLPIQATIIQENWLSDGKDKILDCGSFELDAPGAEGPGAVISLKSTSLPYSGQVRQTKKSRAWEKYNLKGIAEEIAHNGGMTLMFECSVNPFYKRLEQVDMSDIQFLSALCHNAGVSLKATDYILVLFDQAEYEAKPSVLDIEHGANGGYIKYKLDAGEAKTKYASCRVSYVDPDTGAAIEGIAYAPDYKAGDKNNQQLEVSAKVSSSGEAKALAEKRLRLANKFSLTASFTLPGNVDLVAGVTVTLKGWGMWSGKYIVSQAVHSISGSGYTTQIKLRKVLEGY